MQYNEIGTVKSLKFYLESAERAIVRWGLPYMINDEDCISDVAYALMRADINFNGTGSEYGYRGYCAKMAILTLIKNRKPNMRSLDYSTGDYNLYDLIDGKDTAQLRTDLLDLLNNCSELAEREKEVLKHYYFGNLSMEAIAQELGYSSRQMVHYIIKQGLNKLRKEVE